MANSNHLDVDLPGGHVTIGTVVNSVLAIGDGATVIGGTAGDDQDD